MQNQFVADEQEATELKSELRDGDITEQLNRVYGPLGGEDPEIVEFRREAARRGFERLARDEEVPLARH